MSRKIESDLLVRGALELKTVDPKTSAASQFLVLDSTTDKVQYRTAAEVLSDLNIPTTTVSVTADEIAFGTGSGITSSANLKFDNSNKLTVTGTIVTEGTALSKLNRQLYNGNYYQVSAGMVPVSGGQQTNTVFGVSALGSELGVTITGYQNDAFGFFALGQLNGGFNNVSVGSFSSDELTTGYGNTAVGYSALTQVSSGALNTGIGGPSLGDVSTGNYNTGLGYNSGRGITTGNYNTIIGALTTGLDAALEKTVIIASGEGGTGAYRIYSPSSGNVLIGTTTDAGYKLNVAGSIKAGGITGTSELHINVGIATGTNDQGGVTINPGSGHYSSFYRYFTGGNIPGSSLAWYHMTGINVWYGNHGTIAGLPFMNRASEIYNITSSTATTLASKMDATGFRVDVLSNIHTANTYIFSVKNRFYYTETAADARIVLAGSNGTTTLETANNEFYLTTSAATSAIFRIASVEKFRVGDTVSTFSNLVNISTNGGPLTLNSLNSNTLKVVLQNNSTVLSYWGASATESFTVYDSTAGTRLYTLSTTGNAKFGTGSGTAYGNVFSDQRNEHGFVVHRAATDDAYAAFGITNGSSWFYRVNKDGGIVSSFTGSNTFAGSIFVGGVNARISLNPNYVASGETPAGAYLGSSGTGAINIMASADSGTAGVKTVIGYFTAGTGWRSALEVANTTTGVAGELSLMKSAGSVRIGPGTPLTTGTLNVVGTGNAVFTITGNGVGTFASAIYLGPSGSNFSQIAKYSPGYTVNMPGTSVQYSDALFFENPSRNIISQGNVIYNFIGATSTNSGIRLDVTGLKVDTLSNLHIANTYRFEVKGTSMLNGKTTIKHSDDTTDMVEFRNSSNTLFTSIDAYGQFVWSMGSSISAKFGTFGSSSGTRAGFSKSNQSLLVIDFLNTRVGIGGSGIYYVVNDPAALLEVRGLADIVQNSVQAHTSQTANLIEWKNSAGTNLLQFSGSGNLTLSTLAGAGDRMVQVNSAGLQSAPNELIDEWITNASIKTLLETGSNWTGSPSGGASTYTGSAITGTYKGQKHYNTDYLFIALEDDVWNRITLA